MSFNDLEVEDEQSEHNREDEQAAEHCQLLTQLCKVPYGKEGIYSKLDMGFMCAGDTNPVKKITSWRTLSLQQQEQNLQIFKEAQFDLQLNSQEVEDNLRAAVVNKVPCLSVATIATIKTDLKLESIEEEGSLHKSSSQESTEVEDCMPTSISKVAFETLPLQSSLSSRDLNKKDSHLTYVIRRSDTQQISACNTAIEESASPCEEHFKIIFYTCIKNKCVGEARHAIQN